MWTLTGTLKYEVVEWFTLPSGCAPTIGCGSYGDGSTLRACYSQIKSLLCAKKYPRILQSYFDPRDFSINYNSLTVRVIVSIGTFAVVLDADHNFWIKAGGWGWTECDRIITKECHANLIIYLSC